MAADYADVLRLRLAQGDLDGAAHALEEMAHLGREGPPGPPNPFLAAWTEICRVHLALAQNDTGAAARWATEGGAVPLAGPELGYLREFRDLTLARVHLALGGKEGRGESLAQADRLLSRLLAEAKARQRWGRAVGVLALLALVRQEEGDIDRALDLLARSMSLAEPEGYVRTFLDAGTRLAGLLRALSGHDYVGGYAGRLLAAFAGGTAPLPAAPPFPGVVPWDVEPLSEREMEVLELVAAGLTNAQIADRLFIAVSTVKSHTNSIYGKLGVKNRTQAVARAQQLDLL